jgi:ATP-binding cassette subfamily B protein
VFDVLTFVSGDWMMIPAGRDARIAVMRKIQDLDFAYHLSKSTGSLISAIKRGDGAFFGLHHALNNQIARIVVNFIVVLFFFSRIHWEIAAMMAITFAVVVFVMRYLIALSVRRRAVFNDAEDEISSIIVDNLINFETVKLFAKEEREITRLSRSFERWSSALWGHSNAFRTIDVTVGTIGSASFFFILLFAIRGVSGLSFTPGDFVLIVGFLGTFYPKFFQIVYEFRNIAKQHADIERYFAILDSETLVKDPEKPVSLKDARGEISFDKVTFSYPGTKRTSLRNFSLDIRQGQSVAFVGRSGVGKTTLVKLLMRFYDVDGGSIKVDGVDIRNFTKSQLRSFMGVVPQEPILFNDTIGFNIAYGALRDPQGKQTSADKKAMLAAARIARLEEFISHLPDGYNTYVGERGVKLSGGQKQRLAIARMILSNPKIIIFDEATS